MMISRKTKDFYHNRQQIFPPGKGSIPKNEAEERLLTSVYVKYYDIVEYYVIMMPGHPASLAPAPLGSIISLEF